MSECYGKAMELMGPWVLIWSVGAVITLCHWVWRTSRQSLSFSHCLVEFLVVLLFWPLYWVFIGMEKFFSLTSW